MEIIEEKHLHDTYGVEMIFEMDVYEEDEEYRWRIWSKTLIRPQVQDLIEEVNLGTMEEPRITYISSLPPSDYKERIIAILQEFKDDFALNYD